MIVIKYKYYLSVTNEYGMYLLFTYLGLPFRDLTIGTINPVEANRVALESIKPTLLDKREEPLTGDILDLSSTISSFIALEDINPLKNLNMTTLRNTGQDIKDRLAIEIKSKRDMVGDLEYIYEYDPQYPNRIHGVLWIKKANSRYADMYIMVEGRGITYAMYSDTDLVRTVDLTNIPQNIEGSSIFWDYDSNTNNLNFGQQSLQYVHEKKGIITIDGFKLLYNGFYGSGTIQFNDFNYVKRKVLIIPDNNWWKYSILSEEEPDITYITTGLI